jgi:hypothetical protein
MNKNYPSKRYNLLFEKIIALTVAVNFCLILFNLSYIQLRDFYVRRAPQITHIYDPVKGIETHRETQRYLETVDQLETQVSQQGLKSPQTEIQLQELTHLSDEIIDTNPFAGAGKSGTLETIKNRMRKHVQIASAKHAFAAFWNREHLSQAGWKEEINFFDQKIRPLIATNYYRKIGENGLHWDNFWIIDLPFVILFGIELLGRTFYLRRQHRLSWTEAVLWRWYDLFLLLPFWRWLRIIPLVVRLDQSRLVNMRLIQQQINQGILANFAEEITQVVVLRVMNQIQATIKRGEISLWLSQQQNVRSHVDINNVNELAALVDLLAQTIIHQVMPEIQPEITAILRHNIAVAAQQVPIYQNLQNFPGIEQAQAQLNEQLASQITTSLYRVMSGIGDDPVTKKLSGQLVEKFSQVLGKELQKKHVIAEIETLLTDFLEEIKINYVQRLSKDDVDQITARSRQMLRKV